MAVPSDASNDQHDQHSEKADRDHPADRHSGFPSGFCFAASAAEGAPRQ
jgi:hypothetical protein